ncbi:MAG: AAA family ATPase [Desulfobacteraceae bacterium]|nr:AAA family ATPase [Desulfobacteraceae bacterium]
MDDLEKYIFDPENPQKCKVYNLLLNIIKKRDNVAFISPHFFFHIFEKEFSFIKRELWDVPDDFDESDTITKLKCYVSQYSLLELKELVKNITFSDSIIKKLFKGFFDLSLNYKLNIKENDLTTYIDHLYLPYNIQHYRQLPEENMSESNGLMKLELNFISFLTSDCINIFNYLNIKASSVIITTLDEYEKVSFKIDNTHPLLLKDIKDVHLLLDILYRDMQKQENKTIQVEKNIGYLKSIEIENYFCLEDIKINDLEDKKEIYIVGENGDGKTLFLQATLLALKGNEEVGIVSDFIATQKNIMKLKAADNTGKEYSFHPKEKQTDGFMNIVAYGVNRSQNDSDKKEEFGYLTLFNPSQYLYNPVKWLQYLDHKKSRGEYDQIPLELAKKMLKDILDENVEIEVTPDQVIFNERGTEVKFDQLSDGYKNVMIWICDLIERFSKYQPYVNQVKDFRGIVLVDEIDLHLHPRWKYQIARKLRTWFPNIQFIFTTHSSTVILGSSQDAVFYKLYKKNGIVGISKPLKTVKNLMANTILTSPLFALERASTVSSHDKDTDTSDDFLYSIIHKEISERVKADKSITEDQILDMVLKELDKFEAENDKDQ